MKMLNKINSIIFFLIAVYILLYFGASFLIPFVFGIFLASLMAPFSNFLERSGMHRVISSLISTFVLLIVVGGLLYLISYQMGMFARDFPGLIERLGAMIRSIQDGIVNITGLSYEEQRNIVQQRSNELLTVAQNRITNFLSNMLNTVINFLFTLIYVFLLLLYRTKFSNFIMMYVNEENEKEAEEVVAKISKVVYQYLWGRAQVMTILGVLYYITFLIFGLPYAALLSLFGALVTIIPYIGPFISTIFPILFAILYIQGSLNLFLIISLILVIQLVESYVLEPLIIGKEVNLNALIVIIAVLMGAMVWGLAGMILFVPVFAVFKIISTHTENLRPVGYLFGSSREDD